MILRYANALAAGGWAVTIVMPADLGGAPLWRRALRHGRFWIWRFTRAYRPTRWMTMHPRVRLSWVADLGVAHAPLADAVIASSVRTAEAIACWPDSAGRKFYLVQGYETWDFSPDRVRASWRLPLTKLAVSRWLCELIASAGERAVHLPNGLDPTAFGLDRPVESRVAGEVLWPHHWLAQKGSDDVVAALATVSGVQLSAFGTVAARRGWPANVRYSRNPSQSRLRGLYNEASVMVAPSHEEGWGLPACEALQCGCALVATDIGGHREFLRDGHNALLYPPGDIRALRTAVERLMADECLRVRLARHGVEDMQALQFGPCVERLQRCLGREGEP